MSENKCPHLEVRFNAVRKVKTDTGTFRLTGPAWECVWCHQEFVPAHSIVLDTPVLCCDRDMDADGNCDIHSAPGVLRNKAFSKEAKRGPKPKSSK